MRRLIALLALAALAAPQSSGAFEVSAQHPRMFVTDADLPRLRARCAIVDGTNQAEFAAEWGSHADEYARLVALADGYGPDDVPDADAANWSKNAIKAYSVGFSNLAAAYLLNAHRAEGAAYRNTIVTWWEAAVQYARNRNGGSIGPSIDFNLFGRNANWRGYVMAFDHLYDELSSTNPTLRNEIAQWLIANVEEAWTYLHGDSEYPPSTWPHYYKQPWVCDSLFNTLVAVRGTQGLDHALVDTRIAYAHAYKKLDMEARAHNFCGTYSGYRWERPEEDTSSALAWRTAILDEDPLVTYGYHFRNMDDWVMYMTRPNFYESDETGDSHDMDHLHGTFVWFAYPGAVMDRDPNTLWFLDRASEEVGDIPIPWFLIYYNDKSLARAQPTHDTVPLGRYFGDLTPLDGYNSQYAHFRSSWAFSTGDQSTVHGSFLCGPKGMGHDLHSNGHLALFRGQDILTASTGVYDGTNFRHTQIYGSQPISENTILIVDPDNPYITDEDYADNQREGMQAPAPGTTGGAGIYTAEDAYDREHEFGFVERFRNTDGYDVYLYADITTAYPNTRKADLWPAGQTAENVTRQILFQVGRYVVLCDRVTSVNPSATKRVVMHCPSKAGYTLLDGTWNGGEATHPGEFGGTHGQSTDNGVRYMWTKGDSRAFATVLYPKPASAGGPGRKLVRVGGADASGNWNTAGSAEFYLREMGENAVWRDDYITAGEEEELIELGIMGFWRMEIEATGRKEHTFLHVYELTGRDQTVAIPVEYLDDVDEARVGCVIRHPGNGRVNVFGRDEDVDTEAIYGFRHDEPVLHHVADLAPGTYRITETDSGFEATGVVDDASLLTFRSPGGGTFHVVRESDAPDMLAARED